MIFLIVTFCTFEIHMCGAIQDTYYNLVFSKPFANQRFGKESLPITVFDGIFNLSINKSTCDFSRYFCLLKDVQCNFVWFTK